MAAREVDYGKIGARIRKLRIEKGMTQAELSELVDCSNNYLSHVETAQSKVSLTMLLRIAVALNVSLDYFLLDTPYVRPEVIIDSEIADKLKQCGPSTLLAIKKVIDVLLEQEKQLSEE